MKFFRFRQKKLRRIKAYVHKAKAPAKDETAENEAKIARINELSKMARGTWFSLLGYLAFVGVTLLAVEDADFFVSTRKTQLPIINVAIPTSSFFIFGPILGTALFVYLHLYLIRLWDALSEAPAKIGTIPLSEKVMPWLINDFGLAFRKDEAFKGRPMDWVSHSVTFLLVFAAAPFVMGYFWVRHWPSHATLLNGFLAILFAFTLITTFASYHTAYYRLRKGVKYAEKPNHLLALIPFLGICLITIGMTAIKVEGIITKQKASDDPSKDAIYTFYDTPLPTTLNLLWKLSTVEFGVWPKTRRPFALARANLKENDLVGRPADWLEYDDQKRAYRKEFCNAEGLPPAVCGPIPEDGQDAPIIQETVRDNWANKNKLDAHKASTYFANLETRFQSGWKTEYKARTSALPKLNLQTRDLRNAFANQVFLSGADMRGAKLQGADLSEAKLQGADLSGAKLQGANLRKARMQGADLRGAYMQGAYLDNAELHGANLRYANLQGAELRVTGLQGADLRDAWMKDAYLYAAKLQEAKLHNARLQGANFSAAKLQGADFHSAELQGANLNLTKLQGAYLRFANLQGGKLRYAELQGADLRNAKLKSVEWTKATLNSLAHFTDLRGSIGLTQDMLKNVIGNKETLLSASEGHRLHVWSCWPQDNLPPNFEKLLELNAWLSSIEELRAEWVCAEGTEPQPTGTTKPLDAE